MQKQLSNAREHAARSGRAVMARPATGWVVLPQPDGVFRAKKLGGTF